MRVRTANHKRQGRGEASGAALPLSTPLGGSQGALKLSAVFIAATFLVFAAYGAYAASVRSHILSRPRVLTSMRRTFAAAFVGLGVKLALAER